MASATQKKTFAPKVPAFPPLTKNIASNVMNTLSSVSVPNTNLSAPAVSPTMFEDPHTRFVPETNIGGKGPLHTAVSVDGSTASNSADTQSSSSIPQQQQLNLPQQLEGSIAETCRWLINAGVPISAFDPVAIGDFSHSTFAVPQLVSSTSPQQSAIIENSSGTACPSNLNTAPLVDNIKNEIISPVEMNSLLSTGQNANNFDPLAEFDDDPLLTTFLPGEHLPVVDDSLWAL